MNRHRNKRSKSPAPTASTRPRLCEGACCAVCLEPIRTEPDPNTKNPLSACCACNKCQNVPFHHGCLVEMYTQTAFPKTKTSVQCPFCRYGKIEMPSEELLRIYKVFAFEEHFKKKYLTDVGWHFMTIFVVYGSYIIGRCIIGLVLFVLPAGCTPMYSSIYKCYQIMERLWAVVNAYYFSKTAKKCYLQGDHIDSCNFAMMAIIINLYPYHLHYRAIMIIAYRMITDGMNRYVTYCKNVDHYKDKLASLASK